MLPEFEAMQAILDIVSPLSADERVRVAAWLVAYAGQGTVADTSAAPATNEAGEDVTSDTAESQSFSFASLYEAVAPRTNAQKAVVAAWWLERQEGRESWSTHDISRQLGTIGVKVNALSIALANEAKAKDPKIALLEKQGDSMQARKSFQLTEAGVAYVEAFGA